MISFCLVASDHGPLILSRLDYNEGNDGQYGVGAQILATGSHDGNEVSLLKSVLTERRKIYGDGVVAIDCGANIGAHAVEWSKHMRGWGSVLAIEAQERIFYALAGNLALQNCFNARAVWGAVDRKCGELSIPEPDYSVHGSFGSFELKERPHTEYIGQCIDYEEPTLAVRTLSIDSLSLPRVDLIKIDVEGMELDVLAGASETIARCLPDIFIEVGKSDEGAVRSCLGDLRYSLKKVGQNLLASKRRDM